MGIDFRFQHSRNSLCVYSILTFLSIQNCVVWDIVIGERRGDVVYARELRSFDISPPTESPTTSSKNKGHRMDWPFFKWSFDDKYLARATSGPQGMISVYVTPEMNLLDKKSIKVENLVTFQWSPGKDYCISFWTPEFANAPARVTVMKLPNKEIVRTKNLFGVSDVSAFIIIVSIQSFFFLFEDLHVVSLSLSLSPSSSVSLFICILPSIIRLVQNDLLEFRSFQNERKGHSGGSG